MREIRQSGSEGGAAQTNELFLPLSIDWQRTFIGGQPLRGQVGAAVRTNE